MAVAVGAAKALFLSVHPSREENRRPWTNHRPWY